MPSPQQSQDRQGASLRDSWPPTQLRLRNDTSKPKDQPAHSTHEEEQDESHIDPLIYFLSPTPHIHPADTDPSFDDTFSMDDMDMDIDLFSAGIVDSSHPAPIVRSISPSSLTGLALPPGPPPPHPIATKPLIARPPTPPRTPPSRLTSPVHFLFSSSPSSASDEDMEEFYHSGRRSRTEHYEDDGEDYIRLGVGAAGGMLHASHWMRDQSSIRARRARAAAASAVNASSATRGRALARFGPPGIGAAGGLGAAGRGSGSGSGRRSPRAWREPSPEVWDIREETEEEVKEDGDDSMDARVEKKGRGVGKRVRFILPDREAYV